MTDPPDPETLRQRALDVLGDVRARALLEGAEVRLTPTVVRWQGSQGEVQGHRIDLGLDGGALGTLDAHPSLLDVIEEALAAAMARQQGGHILAELRTFWSLEAVVAGPYRGSTRRSVRRDDPQALRRALEAYLEQRGQSEAAQWVQQAAKPDRPAGAPPTVRAALQQALGRLRGLSG